MEKLFKLPVIISFLFLISIKCGMLQDTPKHDTSFGEYIGCYDNYVDEQFFVKKIANVSDLTPEVCRKRCNETAEPQKAIYFSFVGLWGGANCWCTDDNPTNTTKLNKVNESICNSSCRGNRSIACGNNNPDLHIFSVYSICQKGFYGRDCNKRCNCENDRLCTFRGVCPGFSCALGWESDRIKDLNYPPCSKDIDECQTKCNDTIRMNCHDCSENEAWCNNNLGSFQCICKDGFVKSNPGSCIDVDECENGTHRCNQTCKNTIGSYKCECNEGFNLTADGFMCKDIDECTVQDMNRCNQTCNNTYGSYTCGCREGFRLSVDNYQCNDINECDENPSICPHNCRNNYGNYSCSCRRGYEIDKHNHHKCNDINECANNRSGCHHGCNNTEGSYFCHCRDGFSLDLKNNRTCDDVDECADQNLNKCNQNCTNTVGSYECSCQPGFYLNDSYTCFDVNECDDGSHRCNQTCNNTDGSYTCGCREGFQLDDNYQCSDIDECQTGAHRCNQTCNNTIGSHICGCELGFQINADGHNCNDIDECKMNKGGCQHYCNNTPGSFSCSCHPGYRIVGDHNSTTGIYNCSDIDECAEGSSGCEHNCSNTDGSCICSCRLGFQLHSNRHNCEDVDECATGKHQCSQLCQNHHGYYSCSCDPGYYLDGQHECHKDHASVILTVVLILFVIFILVLGVVVLKIRRIYPFDKQRVPGILRKWISSGVPRENGMTPMDDLKSPIIANEERVPAVNSIQKSVKEELMKKSARKTLVAVKDLKNYIYEIQSTSGFEEEFKSIPMTSDFSYDVAQAQSLKPKNRFKNILPYDYNRVKLDEIRDDPLTTYINASFIKGYNKHDKIIASHGPTPNTQNDFWRMIWQYDVNVIVMVTKCMEDGKRKCEQYWPLDGSMESGDLTITLVSTETLPDYVISRLTVTKDKSSRLIVHLLFTDWPDHGVPDHATSLISFRRAARGFTVKDKFFLVHCSAGVGRTGTFIAIDFLLQQAKAENSVDVYKCLQELRDQRMNAVQTLDQYEFIHLALLETLTLGETTVQCPSFSNHRKDLEKLNPLTEKSFLQTEFDMLQEMHPPPSEELTCAALDGKNKARNRDIKIIPNDLCRVFLPTEANGGSDYINAVFVSSYRQKDSFISCELPLPETISEFWLMMINYRCKILVYLDTSGATEDLNNSLLIPQKTKLAVNKHKVWTHSFEPKILSELCNSYPIAVSTPPDDEEDIYANAEEIPAYKILVLHFRLPVMKSQIARSLPQIHEQIKTSSHNIKDNGPVVVVSRDGVSPSGQFIAVSNLLEMALSQGEVDVFNAVHNIKRTQPHFVTSIDDYLMIFDALEGEGDVSTYANI